MGVKEVLLCEGLKLRLGEDGYWLHFKASNLKEALVNLAAISEDKDIIGGAILQWAEDIIKEEGKEKVIPIEQTDSINHPQHYTSGGIEAIDVIEAWGLPFHLGNVVKYICRAGHKEDMLKDLKKARWYLNRYIEKSE